MSYIRMTQPREWSEGEPDLYVYPSSGYIVRCPGWSVRRENWLEVTMRMLERQTDDEEFLERVCENLEEELYRYD